LSNGVDGGDGDGLFFDVVWSRNLTSKFVELRTDLFVIESGERKFGFVSVWFVKCESIVSVAPGNKDFDRIPPIDDVKGNEKVRFSSWDSRYSCNANCRRSRLNCL